MFFKRRRNSNTTSERINLNKKILLNKRISKIVSEADIVHVFNCQCTGFFVCDENIGFATQVLTQKALPPFPLRAKKNYVTVVHGRQKKSFFCFASTGYVVIANPCNSPETKHYDLIQEESYTENDRTYLLTLGYGLSQHVWSSFSLTGVDGNIYVLDSLYRLQLGSLARNY
uniref:Uncharacterized protein n=1 Tax=Glossina pallidipes TaxID=7398 RepID=A0A1A9Z612_GLOPL